MGADAAIGLGLDAVMGRCSIPSMSAASDVSTTHPNDMHESGMIATGELFLAAASICSRG